MPQSNWSKGNSSSKKSRKMRRSVNKKNLIESPEATPRDIPEIDGKVAQNIEDVSIEISSTSVISSVCNRQSAAHKKKQSKRKNHHNKKQENMAAAKVVEYTEKKEETHKEGKEGDRVTDVRPCAKCRQFFFDPLCDEETEIA